MDWSEILLALIAAAVAILAGGFVFKKISNNTSNKTKSINIVSQRNNTAGGDIVGGNSVKDSSKH